MSGRQTEWLVESCGSWVRSSPCDEYVFGMNASDAPNPSDDRWDASAETPLSEVVTSLREWLGARLTAYIGGVKHTRPVAEWADGASEPAAEDTDRLRLAYDVVCRVLERYDTATLQAWMQGMNPALGDVAPARVIREREPGEVRDDVMSAATSFAYIG
jgi:hypothetical protein